MTVPKNIQNNSELKKSISLSVLHKFLVKLSASWLLILLVILMIVTLIFAIWLFIDVETNGTKDRKTTALTQLEADVQHNVFGDHFSNNLSIDNNKTSFYYDETTTAYTFIPSYDWSKLESCSDAYCGQGAAAWFFPGENIRPTADNGSSLKAATKDATSTINQVVQKYCIAKRCLELDNDALIYQGKKIALPNTLKGTEVLNITIYPLSNDWLVGYVVKDKNNEFGRAYRFDGSRFTDLDAKNKIPLISRVGFEGAYFGFGGDDKNFLVLYGGYDLLGYQVVGSDITDLKYFFGLRTSGGGFAPSVLKQQREDETIWYVCSRLNGRPRFLKLWQNGSSSIKGILSFSDKLFKVGAVTEAAWCRPGEKSNEVEVITYQNSEYNLNIFRDNDFIQNDSYELYSSNIFKDNGLVSQARFGGLLACGDNSCGNAAFAESLNFSAGTNPENLESVVLGKELTFEQMLPGLYWKISNRRQSESSYYSPWIDGVTEISYAWQKK